MKIPEKKGKSNFRQWISIVAKDFRMNKTIYLMMLLPIIYYILFKFVPMYGAVIAFQDYRPRLGITGSDWVGLKHFIKFINLPSFGQLLLNTIKISATSLLFGFPAPIILALLFNEIGNKKFSKLVQSIAYMPHFISLVVVCGMITSFTLDTGVIPQFLSYFGFEPKSLLAHSEYFLPVYIGSNLWQQVGWGSIIYIAAIAGIDPSLYEAAKIDGANRWKQTIHVTLPGIASTVIVLLILRIGSILNVGYEKIILLYNDSTMKVADVISTYVYRRGLLDQDWSFSSAVGIFNSVINFFMLVLANKLSKKINETSLW